MKDDRVYLLHIQDAIRQIELYTCNGEQAFLSDRKTQDAVIRNFEIIGEASRNISETTRARFPTLRWTDIIGMRNKLIHEYFGVNLQLVWTTIRRELPVMRTGIDGILLDIDSKRKT